MGENSAVTPSLSSNSQNASNVAHDLPSSSGLRPDMMMGMSNPGQMSEMIQNISPAELQGMASMMGLTPEQLTATAQMISQMPPEQFQEYMTMAMQRGGMGDGSDNDIGNGGNFRPQVLRMNEEEMAAVDRLADMGFDRTEAVQAYLACDKNEALAANLLMDGGFDLRDDNINNRSGGGANTNN